jgi:hypothetical protein
MTLNPRAARSAQVYEGTSLLWGNRDSTSKGGPVLFRFACGHTGRTNDSYRARTQAFIRVAEVRGVPIEDRDSPCPDCKR